MSLEASSDRNRVLQGFGSLRIRFNVGEDNDGDRKKFEGNRRCCRLPQPISGQRVTHGCW